jgi:hypothetical protein
MVSLSFGGTILFFISLYYRERIHSKQLTFIGYINNTSIHTSDLELQDFAASTWDLPLFSSQIPLPNSTTQKEDSHHIKISVYAWSTKCS